MNWLERFKIALIEEDEELLNALAGDLPTFESVEEMEAAMSLLSEARALFERKKELLAERMREIESARKFLTSHSPDGDGALDVTS